MRPVPLTVVRGGINRLKVKGGANAQQLYDLTNAYITQAGTIVPREGTIRNAALTSATVGLAAFDGNLNVFATSLQTVPAGYVCNLLIHPTNPAATLTKIWFAKPFLGFLYVVAQFSTGDIFHYWLQSNGTWTANNVYKTGAIVTPKASPNGLAYQAVRDMPANSTWGSNSVVSLGTVVEPNTYTGFAYRAVAVAGSAPHTGTTEPAWPSTAGATIQEFGDFDTTSAAASSSTKGSVPLGSNITDRYGDSSEIAGQTGTAGNATTTVAASTSVTTWAQGTLYAPGAVVQPSVNQGAFINAVPNGDFEAGNDGNWTMDTGWSIATGGGAYQGSYFGAFGHTGGGFFNIRMTNYGVVTPGQSVTASCYGRGDSDGAVYVMLSWYDSSDTHISDTLGQGTGGTAGGTPGQYSKLTVTGNAPANAAHCRVGAQYQTGSSSARAGAVDLFDWNLEKPAAVSTFLYEAVQANPATSGSTEPAWPTTAGNTVIDGGVTWKAIGTSIVTWQAVPIMQSGAAEPTWPTAIGTNVYDASTYTTQDGHVTNTSMSWVAINRQVSTPHPGKAVCLGASHVFNGDNDIVDYSAAVDPTDWVTANNAGYLPTGLNNYGDNPVAVLVLYRSNLMAFNAGGYQMWQIDPDPANMALLDAQPVGSIYTRSWQSVANDTVGLTEVGVRNIGVAGATANLQMGSTGQPVDPIVNKQRIAGNGDYLSLYYPGRGQYWLFFGSMAMVLTMNGSSQKSWSRYTFPDVITDWTLNEGILYLRSAGNLVWQFDYNTLVDDSGGTNTAFTSTIQWPYLDAGALGFNKGLIGVDLVGFGAATIQVAYQQADVTTFSDNAGFATSQNVTAPYTVSIVDTVPGEPLPIPINAPSYSLILQFNSNQPGLGAPNSPSWEWEGANLYVADQGGGGVTG